MVNRQLGTPSRGCRAFRFAAGAAECVVSPLSQSKVASRARMWLSEVRSLTWRLRKPSLLRSTL